LIGSTSAFGLRRQSLHCELIASLLALPLTLLDVTSLTWSIINFTVAVLNLFASNECVAQRSLAQFSTWTIGMSLSSQILLRSRRSHLSESRRRSIASWAEQSLKFLILLEYTHSSILLMVGSLNSVPTLMIPSSDSLQHPFLKRPLKYSPLAVRIDLCALTLMGSLLRCDERSESRNG